MEKETKRPPTIFVPPENYEIIEHLTDAQLGALFRAIFIYHIQGIEIVSDSVLKIAFKSFKVAMDSDAKRYCDKVEVRRQAAIEKWKRYNEQKNASDAKNANAEFALQNMQTDANDANTTQHNTTQHNTTQHNSTQYNTTQHNTASITDDDIYINNNIIDICANNAQSATNAQSANKNKNENERKFVKPTIEEVESYAAEKQVSKETAANFWNYYESQGWRVGRNPMKKWRAAFVGWCNREKDYETNRNFARQAGGYANAGGDNPRRAADLQPKTIEQRREENNIDRILAEYTGNY